MMLGRENPMVYTPEEIFNPTVANMVLLSMGTYANALREDYKDAQNKEEQFMKEYGSFMSPIAADQEYYYNNTLGGLGKMFEEADRQGVDLLRSQQGRALIQRYIMSRPYAQLANMRQSAEAANQYKTILAKGIADGTLDYDTAVKLDGDLSTWNTATDGMWSKVAPTSQRTINQMLAPYIEDLNKYGYEYDAEASARRGLGWIVKRVSDQAIKDELNKHAADIMRDPMMLLRVKESGLTPDEYIASELYTHMRRELTDKEDKDDVFFANEGLKNDRARLDLDRKKFNLDAEKTKAEIDAIRAKAEKDRAAANGKDGSYSYNQTSFNTAMEARGFSGYVTQDGKYISPSEHEDIIKTKYIYDNIKNTNVFIKNKNTGKWDQVKFGSLSKSQQAELVARDGSKIRQQFLSAERQFYQHVQRRLINDYIKRGGTVRTSSMAFASHDDANQWMSDIHPSQYVYDDENKSKVIGVDARSEDVKDNLFTIGEVSSRTGQHGKEFSKRKYSENNSKKDEVAYFNAANEGNSAGQIYQWEAYDGQYHRYRKVNTYNEHGDYLGLMWIQCMNPTSINSSRGQGWDNRAVRGAGGSTKSIPSALDTVSLDEDSTQS